MLITSTNRSLLLSRLINHYLWCTLNNLIKILLNYIYIHVVRFRLGSLLIHTQNEKSRRKRTDEVISYFICILQSGSIFSAAGDSCAYCWDLVRVF